MTRNTLNYCLKFPLCFISCHICYGKSEANIFSTVIKVKLLASKVSNSCSEGLSQLVKIPKKFIQFERKLGHRRSQMCWIEKISLACISCRSCQNTRPIFSSRTYRISSKLSMQHHIYLLSSLIISFHILTTLFLCYMFSKGQVTLT